MVIKNQKKKTTVIYTKSTVLYVLQLNSQSCKQVVV